LRLGANVAVLHGTYGNLNLCVDALGPCTIVQGGVTVLNPATNLNLKGNTIARAPKLSSLLFADYKVDVGEGSLSLHGEAAYRSRTYYSPYQLKIQSSDPYWLFNANLRYDFPGNKYFVSVYGQNLFDKVYFTHVATVARFLGPIDGLPQYVHYGPPRTYGVRVGVSF
jgi:iron complex outermembrane receptor protein